MKQGTKDYTTVIAGAYAISQYYPSIGGMVSYIALQKIFLL